MKKNLLLGLLLTASVGFAQFTQTGEVVITEIHNRPNKPTTAQLMAVQDSQPSYWAEGDAFATDQIDGDEDHTEWFEIYNPGSVAVVMDGWKIEDASKGAGSGIVIGTFTLGAGEYAVFSGTDIPDAQGGVQFDYFWDYESIGLNNESTYSDSTDANCPDGIKILKADDTLVDVVLYDYGYDNWVTNGAVCDVTESTGFPGQDSNSKTSFQLDGNNLDASKNDEAIYWTYSEDTYDTTNSQKGTPGTANATDEALSRDDVFASKFSVYPNPANGVVTINNADVELASLQLVNTLGRTVYASKVTSTLDVSSIPTGVYFLNLKATDGASATKKLIIE